MNQKLKVIIASLLALGTLVAISACGKNTSNKDNKPIVAVSIVPQATFVEAVCGDLVDIVTMVPPGSSPASHEPTASQMQKLSDATVYFSIGVPTEKANILPNIGDVKLVALDEAVEEVYEARKSSCSCGGSKDPHIWLSPKRVKVMVEKIKEEMIKIDSDNEDKYKENAERFIKQLDELDSKIKTTLENVKNRSFIVYHPAFGYLADDYGLKMYSLEKHGKEATAKHLEEMIDFAKENNIKVIFYQKEIDSKQSQAFAEEIGGKSQALSPLSPNYIENLLKMAETLSETLQK